jgi:hypothetical protein
MESALFAFGEQRRFIFITHRFNPFSSTPSPATGRFCKPARRPMENRLAFAEKKACRAARIRKATPVRPPSGVSTPPTTSTNSVIATII